jgi:hypothetical protein
VSITRLMGNDPLAGVRATSHHRYFVVAQHRQFLCIPYG